jgi:hypothetical protein
MEGALASVGACDVKTPKPDSLACRAGPAHRPPSGAGIRDIPVESGGEMAEDISEGGYLPRPADTRALNGSNDDSSYRITFLLVGAILAFFAIVAYYLVHEPGATSIAVAMVLSILLAALPILLCHVQGTSRERQLARLNSLSDHPVSRTSYYTSAHTAIKSIEPVSLDRYYLAPIATLAAVLVFGFLAIFLATQLDKIAEQGTIAVGQGSTKSIFGVHSFFFGGQAGIFLTGDELISYQKQTFLMLAMAFVGSYIYMLTRLQYRILNNDIYPMSFYYYATRLIISCAVAIVFRHLLGLFGLQNQLLVLIGFVIGFAPDLFILVIARRAFQLIKIAGDQPDPAASELPTNLNLLMIEGMSRDKIDRLAELGIDSAQYLACQNPLILWPRLPYDLYLLVDWIGQAQLYRLAKEVRLRKMREIGVNNIFDLHTALSDKDAAASVCRDLDIDPASVAAQLSNLDQDPPFRRLREVRNAL